MQFIENDKLLCADGNRSARKRLLEIADATISAVQPDQLVPKQLTRSDEQLRIDGTDYDLRAIENLFVIGAGKGSASVVKAVVDVLGDRITEGIVVEKHGQGTPIDADSIELIEAGHPVPDADSLEAGERVRQLADRAGPNDLVVYCITGGASALVAAPAGALTIDDLVATNEQLLEAGLPIQSINTVRKHLSAIKGGRLAVDSTPASIANLIVVDEVAGDPWGPTVPDGTTYSDAINVLVKHELDKTVPKAVMTHLTEGADGIHPETPDVASFTTVPVTTTVLADGPTVCEAAQTAAEDRGLPATILSTTIEGEARTVGSVHGDIACEIATYDRPVEPPCLVISGGETTVTVTGDGKGGPNQECALGLAQKIAGNPAITGLCIDTDGTDGPTQIAGGLVDGRTIERMTEQGLDPITALRENDVTDVLTEIGDAVRTQPTGTNLMDLRLILIEGS